MYNNILTAQKGQVLTVTIDRPKQLNALNKETISELHLALSIVKEINRNIKIVNIPCWELFEQQSKEYKDKILTLNCRKRVSIEAGTTLGWEKFVGQNGLKIGIDDFGFSAPGIDVAMQFNFTKESIKSKIEEYLNA